MKLLFLALGLCCFAGSYAQQKPNIIVILADDMGYSDIHSYGGEVETPNLDNLASTGIRYKQFYNGARCCPTRASLISGVYPHQAGMGWMAAANLETNPSYQDDLSKNCVTIAEVLKGSGYSTYMTGKWHLTNERKIDGRVTDSWPKQRGFDRYFGIVPGGANYFTPTLYSNNNVYKAPENFYLTNAISDTSVRYISEHKQSGTKDPFFMYVAYTSPHWPLHALQAEIDKYKDRYKEGWDVIRAKRFQRQKEIGLVPANAELSPRDESIPAWNTLSEKEKDEYAMRMAIYAAQIDIMDQGIGRIVSTLKDQGMLDNTLIFFLSDNGACAEFISSGASKEVNGKAETFESYRINWANVSSTPFKEYKHFTYEGGIATPLIVHWPKGITPGLNNSFVSDYGHITDIMATCVDVAKANYPATYLGNKIVPMQGKTLQPNFTGGHNNRGKVFWEHEANIAMRDGRYKMVAKTEENQQLNFNTVHLYDMEKDPTEMHDLAKAEPARTKSMYDEWTSWAKSIDAFPLDTREYNVRMKAYHRSINGEFDDNLGGWSVKTNGKADALIDTDEHSVISGKKSARVVITKAGEKPADVQMFWPFPVKKNETYRIGFTVKSAGTGTMYVRLEKAGGQFDKVIDQEIALKPGVNTYSFTSPAIPEAGQYRLAYYFGKLPAGAVIWLDKIVLTPQQ